MAVLGMIGGSSGTDVQLLPDGTLLVNGVPYSPPGQSDDQVISVSGSNVVLEDGGQLDGQICTDLAGNTIGLIIQQ